MLVHLPFEINKKRKKAFVFPNNSKQKAPSRGRGAYKHGSASSHLPAIEAARISTVFTVMVNGCRVS
jgi:hypothetical protein